ncbi:hypothetical protein T265_03428 [Opisthorchis viverrini]|uniref:Uncharacterized protein n=1 Tax=Opisthorchis viverrini TaxID=6198 RepID=A0A075A3A5_OPIVI|nr:hypothetical protein T265_03428 [Opisthorchis viverrini]KER30055.1 hypothetical protein T265_03428 [Opisthorchis viverrini]
MVKLMITDAHNRLKKYERVYRGKPNELKTSSTDSTMVVGLFAELDSWIANVSSPIEVTSSVRG